MVQNVAVLLSVFVLSSETFAFYAVHRRVLDSHDKLGQRPHNGGIPINPKLPEYKKMAEESMRMYSLNHGLLLYYKVVEITSVIRQLAAGLLTDLEFTVVPTDCRIDEQGYPEEGNCHVMSLREIKCESEVWNKVWLRQKEIKVKCALGIKEIEEDEDDDK